MKIAVAGGGITGLTFMNCLQKSGINTLLFEQKESFQEKGSGILLGVNAMKILRELGLEEETLQKGRLLQRITQVTAKGAVLAALDTGKVRQDTGQNTVCISRPDLHRILSQNLTPEQVSLDAQISGVRPSGDEITINVSSKDGGASEQKFDFLAGADGIHSAVRESFFGKPELRYSGYTCWRFIIDAPADLDQNLAWEFVGTGRRFGVFPQGQNKVYCFATLNTRAGFFRDQELSKEEFAELFREFPMIVPDCLEQLQNDPDARLIRKDIADLKTAILTAPGIPVIFAGDAGHATTPNMGQGAAMGMEDAHVFAQILAEGYAPHDAAAEFAARRTKRVEAIRTQSLFMGKIGQLENRYAAAFRNAMMRLVPQTLSRKSMQSLLLHRSVFPAG